MLDFRTPEYDSMSGRSNANNLNRVVYNANNLNSVVNNANSVNRETM